MAQIKFAEYTMSNDTNVLPILTPDTISTVVEDVVGTSSTKRTVYIDDTTLPTKISFKRATGLLTLDYLHFTNRITSMNEMFYGCTNTTAIDTTGWDTSSVTDMSYAFASCHKLTGIDVSKFTTNNLTNLAYTFSSCGLINVFDLSSFNVDKVTNMKNLFANIGENVIINLSNWNLKIEPDLFVNLFGRLTVLMYNTTSTSISNLLKGSNVNGTIYVYGVDDVNGIYDGSSWTIKNRLFGTVVAKYKFTTGVDTLPTFNTDYTYIVSDTVNEDGTTTRTITNEHDTVPTSMRFSGTGLLEVYELDVSGLTSFSNLFNGCEKLTTIHGHENWDTTKITSFNATFQSCKKLQSLDMTNWDVSNVTSFDSTFYACDIATSFGDLSKWNVSKAKSMYFMFRRCSKITTLGDISNWDVSECTNFRFMFFQSGLIEIDITNWKYIETESNLRVDGMFGSSNNLISIKGLENMPSHLFNNVTQMFYGSSKITTLEGLSEWKITNKITALTSMFANCSSLTTLDLSGWDVSKVTVTTSCFDSCTNLVSLNIDGWDLSSATTTTSMFNKATSLATIEMSECPVDTINTIIGLIPTKTSTGTISTTVSQDQASNIDTATATSKMWNIINRFPIARYKFTTSVDTLPTVTPNNTRYTDIINEDDTTTRTIYNTESPTSISFDSRSGLIEVEMLDITNKITSLASAFNNCTALVSVNMTGWDTSNVTTIRRIFNGCTNLAILNDINKLNVEKLEDMGYFMGKNKIEELDLSNWNPINLTSIQDSFGGANLLHTLNISGWNVTKIKIIGYAFRSCSKLTTLDFSGWDMTNVKDTTQAFNGCSSLKEIKFKSNLKFGNNTNFSRMFAGCGLETLDVSNWDVSSVTKMEYMFEGCNKLTTLDVSNWDVSKVTTFSSTFSGCSNLETLDVSNWDVSSVSIFQNTFSGCKKLTSLNVDKWDTSSATNMGGLFYNCASLTSLDLSSFTTNQVTYLRDIFNGCSNLQVLDLSNFNTDIVTDTTRVFNNCTALKDIGLVYCNASTVNTIVSLVPTNVECNVYYYDADPSQLTPVEGVTFKKYSFPTKVQLPPHIHLHSLPDGTRDEVDLATGILTKNVGYIMLSGDENISKSSLSNDSYSVFVIEDYNEHLGEQIKPLISNQFGYIENIGTQHYGKDVDKEGISYYTHANGLRISISSRKSLTVEEFRHWLKQNKVEIMFNHKPTTEQLILSYNNSCDYGRILPTGMCDKYDVVNSMYTQTMTSILLNGVNIWDNIEYLGTVLKFTATGTTVGVDNLNMKGAGGLYCDNDLFPNINDDSDVEHCRVDAEGNKFYIYISKDRLMSPDLIGYQIWLQTNPFNMWYELEEHLIYTKPYEELDPTQARWDTMDCTRGGSIKYNTHTEDGLTIYPTLEYVAPSINNFEVPMLEPNTEYTMYAEGIGEGDTINLGGTDIEFANGTVYTSGENQWLRIDNNDSFYNVVITKGDTTGEVVPYFEGITSVENPKIITKGEGENESVIEYSSLKLRSLPNGVKDTVNVLTGEYIQRVGEVVLNGSEKWRLSTQSDDYIDFRTILDILSHNNASGLCDNLNYQSNKDGSWIITDEGITVFNSNEVILSILKTRLHSIDTSGIKTWLQQNPTTVLYELKEPIITKLDPQTLLAYTDGTINLSSETGFLPTMTYSVPSTNVFNLPSIKTGTRYTLKYPSASGSISIGDMTYKVTSPSMLFTTPLTMSGDASAVVFADTNPQDVMLIEGDYSKREISFFVHLRSSENIAITTTYGDSTNTVETGLTLRSLPNGLSDKLNFATGKLVRVADIRDYQEGDNTNRDVYTDGYKTVYPLTNSIETTVEVAKPVGYSDGVIELKSDALIPTFRYRLPSSNNFVLDLLKPSTKYTMYANYELDGNFTLGGTMGAIGNAKVVSTSDSLTDTNLTFSGNLGLSNVMLVEGDSTQVTTPKFNGLLSVENATIQLTGSPTEINRLTIPDTVKLRSIGSIIDELDLVTGVFTKRIECVKLIGSENWQLGSHQSTNYQSFKIDCADLKQVSLLDNMTCDRFKPLAWTTLIDNTFEFITGNGTIEINIHKNNLSTPDVDGFKRWLRDNPTTVHYELARPVTKTLDLAWTTKPVTSYYGTTTVQSSSTDGQTLKPYFQIVVPITSLEEIVDSLKEKNARLEEDNLATMIAVTEVFEVMLMMMPVNMAVSNQQGGGSYMVEVYVTLILKGKKTLEQVPAVIRPQVEQMLKDLDAI